MLTKLDANSQSQCYSLFSGIYTFYARIRYLKYILEEFDVDIKLYFLLLQYAVESVYNDRSRYITADISIDI